MHAMVLLLLQTYKVCDQKFIFEEVDAVRLELEN